MFKLRSSLCQPAFEKPLFRFVFGCLLSRMKLATGTYGPRALKEIPRPKAKGRSRRGSQSSQRNAPPASATSTTERRYEKKAEAAPTSKGSQEGAKLHSDAPSAQGSMEYLASEPRVLGYEPPPTAIQSQPQGLVAYPAEPAATSQPQPTSAYSEPQVTTYTQPTAPQGYQRTPSSSQPQGLGYQPPAGPDEPVTPKGLGYQPPPGPDEPFFNLYAQPKKKQRQPQPGYPDTRVSVPALSPMPPSPMGPEAPRYSMGEMQQPGSAAHLSIYGLPPAGQSESEL